MKQDVARPTVTLTSFAQDEEGDWVAHLSCGHTQHVRHRPPWQERPWVTSEEGRRSHIGMPMSCPLCLMPRLPDGAEEYQRTREFDANSTPAGLLNDHRTKAGTWGKIVVLEGRVGYRIQDEQQSYFVLKPNTPGIVAPTQTHHVEPQPGARFYVAFMRVPDALADSDNPADAEVDTVPPPTPAGVSE